MTEQLSSDCRQAKRRLLRTRGAAEYLGISEWRIRQLMLSGKLPFVRDCEDCNLQFDLCDLDQYIRQHRQVLTVE